MNWKQTFKDMLREKGYLLAFSLCLAAVAVSGWLFVRSLRSTDDELIVPDAVQAAVLPTLPQAQSAGRQDTPLPGAKVKPIHPVNNGVPATEPHTEPAPETEAPSKSPAPRVRPVEGSPLQGYSMDKLIYNPTTRDWRTHAGTDLAAPAGSPVKAAEAGTVLAVFEDDLLGTTVTLDHGSGWVSHYANLDPELKVAPGDRVSAGQVIGSVGKTALGEAGSEAHLHFAVYRNNVPQDPEAFLAGK